MGAEGAIHSPKSTGGMRKLTEHRSSYKLSKRTLYLDGKWDDPLRTFVQNQTGLGFSANCLTSVIQRSLHYREATTFPRAAAYPQSDTPWDRGTGIVTIPEITVQILRRNGPILT